MCALCIAIFVYGVTSNGFVAVVHVKYDIFGVNVFRREIEFSIQCPLSAYKLSHLNYNHSTESSQCCAKFPYEIPTDFCYKMFLFLKREIMLVVTTIHSLPIKSERKL